MTSPAKILTTYAGGDREETVRKRLVEYHPDDRAADWLLPEEAEAGGTKLRFKVDGTRAVADVRAALEKNHSVNFSRSEPRSACGPSANLISVALHQAIGAGWRPGTIGLLASCERHSAILVFTLSQQVVLLYRFSATIIPAI